MFKYAFDSGAWLAITEDEVLFLKKTKDPNSVKKIILSLVLLSLVAISGIWWRPSFI